MLAYPQDPTQVISNSPQAVEVHNYSVRHCQVSFDHIIKLGDHPKMNETGNQT